MKTTLISTLRRSSFVVGKATNIARFLEMRRAFFACEKQGREWSFSVVSNVRGDVIQYALDHSKKRMDAFMEMFCAEIAAEAREGHLSKEQMLSLYQLGCRRGHWDILLNLALRVDLPDELIEIFLHTRMDEVKRHFLLRNYRLKRRDIKDEFLKFFAKNYDTLYLDQLVPLLCDEEIIIRKSAYELCFRLLPKFAGKMSKELKALQRQGRSNMVSVTNCRRCDMLTKKAIKRAVTLCNTFLFISKPVRIQVKDILPFGLCHGRPCRNPLFQVLDIVFKAQALSFSASKIRFYCSKISGWDFPDILKRSRFESRDV